MRWHWSFLLLVTAALAHGAQTFVLSDEASGHLVTKLVAAGYGPLNPYETLQQMVEDTNPSVAVVITPGYLKTLHSLPAASQIFTNQLKSYPGSTVAVSDDGTVQIVNILGATYYNQPGTTTLSTNIADVGAALVTYSTTSQPLTSFQQGATTYNVFAIAWAGPPAPPPALVSLSPPVSTGSSQPLTVTYNAPGGYQSLNVVNVLINNFLDGRQACYLAYSVPSNNLYIVPDNGDGTKLTGKAMDGIGTIANSQCTVTFSGSSATGNGNTFTLILNLGFTASFGGNKVIYAAARDLANGNSGWQTMGVHGVPPLPSTFPNPVGLNPSSGNTLTTTITFTYQDQSTAANLQTVWALINTAIDGRTACYVAYYRPGNQLYLYPDNGDGTEATNIVLVGNNTIGNSQCTIPAQGASVQTNGNTLTVTLPIAFKTAFANFQGVWLAAQTMGAAQTSAWQALGAWIVPAQ